MQQPRDLVKDFIVLRNFVSKFVTGIKLNDNRFDKTDFVDMMKQFPEAYKNANFIYKNPKVEKIIPMILATLINDLKLTGTNNNPIFNEVYRYITSGELDQEAKNTIEPLNKQKIDGDIDCNCQTAIYLSYVINYLYKKLFTKPQSSESEFIQQVSETNENYYLMDLFNEDDSGYDNITTDSKHDNDLMTVLQELIGSAIFNMQTIIKKKQFDENIQNIFPSSYALSSFSIALGMIYSQVLFL